MFVQHFLNMSHLHALFVSKMESIMRILLTVLNCFPVWNWYICKYLSKLLTTLLENLLYEQQMCQRNLTTCIERLLSYLILDRRHVQDGGKWTHSKQLPVPLCWSTTVWLVKCSWKETLQGCTRRVIIGQCICCITRHSEHHTM